MQIPFSNLWFSMTRGQRVLLVAVTVACLGGGALGLDALANRDVTQYNQIVKMANSALHGDVPTVRALLDSGIPVDAQAGRQRNSLQQAALGGQTEMVRFLLKRGADPNKAVPFAAGNKRPDVLALLCAHGARLDGEAGADALHNAVERQHIAVVTFLLEHEINPNVEGRYRQLPIQTAAFNGLWPIFQTLVRHGASVQKRSSRGETALMRSVVRDTADSLRISRYLIAQGVDVNARDEDGRTALIYAVYFDRGGSESTEPNGIGQINLLLENGADVRPDDKHSMTALDYAVKHQLSQAKVRLRQAESAARPTK